MNAALGYGRPAQVADGHEQWFLDESPKNRMVLALLSGVDDEISWSLFRLGHLSHQHGQRFFIQPFFGLTDALMEWPFWYIRENGGFKDTRPDALGGQTDNWFISADIQKKRKHALESLLILRNASFEQGNAVHLITNHTQRTLALLAGLQSLPNIPLHAEFILHLADIFHGLAAHIVLPPLTLQTHIPKPTIPLNTICNLVSTTKDRSLVIALLNGLAQLFNHNNNSGYVSSTSPALDTAIRYLPLSEDRALLAASLDYLFAHLSHPPAAKAFLHHPRMTNSVKLLVTLLLLEQEVNVRSQPLGPTPPTAPQEASVPLYQLTSEELQKLIDTPEPQRCIDWMQRMYVYDPEEDEIQSSVWVLYRDSFTPYADKVNGGLAVAQDVIKKIMEVFPKAQAIVDPGPPQRYVVRGIKRRLQEGAFKCRWDQGACNSSAFETVHELYVHLLGHLTPEEDAMACQWVTCPYGPVPLDTLKRHIMTHLPIPVSKKNPSQPQSITLPLEPFPHPSAHPTSRPPPPPPPQMLELPMPVKEPSSISLSALLILRILFRAAFPDSGPAPPMSDENRFGFPMPPALTGEIQALVQAKEEAKLVGEIQMDIDGVSKESEAEMDEAGQRKGRKAFERVASGLAQVRMADDSLSGWIEEMVSAANLLLVL